MSVGIFKIKILTCILKYFTIHAVVYENFCIALRGCVRVTKDSLLGDS